MYGQELVRSLLITLIGKGEHAGQLCVRLLGLAHPLLCFPHCFADSKKNVLVLRFFLLFSLLDVP